MTSDIDLVVPWVDGNDPSWREQKDKYEIEIERKIKNKSHVYYRDWGLMRYWFRGVERNLPWIHRIYFLTCGHVPAWLNRNHPKLRIVRHEEFIQAEFRPTFSSHPIEWNMYRIEELAEQFIYANDDMFFVGPVDPMDYFYDGLPCDCLCLKPITESCMNGFGHILWNNIVCINRHFSLKDCIEENKEKWFAASYSPEVLALNNIGFQLNNFPGLWNGHLPIPFLKSSFEKVWEAEPQLLRRTCNHRFRSNEDVSDWLVRYWQLVTGNFMPMAPKGKAIAVTESPELLRDTILNTQYPVICLNEGTGEIDFGERSAYLCSLLDLILPEMSSFERY